MESDFRNEATKAGPVRGYTGGVGALGDRRDQLVAEKQYYAAEEARASQEPLAMRIERRLREVSSDAEKVLRLQAILNQHPEFETFLEFQDLLNRTRLR